MRKPSMKQAEWITKQITFFESVNPDDVFDVLTGQITQPADFVAEVQYWATEYEEDFRRGNARAQSTN